MTARANPGHFRWVLTLAPPPTRLIETGMHDIKAIRDNPDRYERAWAAKGLEGRAAQAMALDAQLRAAQTAAEQAQARRNELSRGIGAAKGRKDEAEAQRLMAEVEALKGQGAEQAEAQAKLSAELRELLAALPNIPADDVPPGVDEAGNVEVRRHGAPRDIDNPRDHVDLGEGLGLMDFEAAARMSGARFVVLKGQLARLERALGQFMLDVQTTEHGYTEVSPPLLVKDDAAFGTGQLPKFAEDLFRTTNGHWLIPTAEVSLTNIVREAITSEEELPLRMTALTPSFRSEAGASGRDTRGMIRQHQFYKVELVSITTPEQSNDEHERMTACAEAVLKKLELPFRTMLLCAGDMGFSARKTYDLEVWLPSQATYREISSCSNCGDFQARRMDARSQKAGEKGTRFVHTLNGSGLAVGRTLVAVMENYQQGNGAIAVPSVLQPYMGGLTVIGADS
jgi:seryl-tRNA synthetase